MVMPGTHRVPIYLQCSTVGHPSSLGLRARMIFLTRSTLRRTRGDRPTHTIRYVLVLLCGRLADNALKQSGTAAFAHDFGEGVRAPHEQVSNILLG
jgi:hypothetical protein